MRRIQLYLEDQLWDILHSRAQSEQTTMSKLVRQAVRERYLGGSEQLRKAMLEFVGSRQTQSSPSSAVEEVRMLRSGTRLDRFGER